MDSGQRTPDSGAPQVLSVRSMVEAIALLGRPVKKSQVHADYQAGAPRTSAKAYLAWRQENRDLSRTLDGRIDRPQAPARPSDAAPPGQAPAAEISAPSEPDEPADENTAAYRQDRARNERIKADRAELELEQLRGELVGAREVEELQFTAGRIVRDRVLMVPARAVAELHALLLTLVMEDQRASFNERMPLHALERRFEDLLRDALNEAAKAIEEAHRDDDDDDSD